MGDRVPKNEDTETSFISTLINRNDNYLGWIWEYTKPYVCRNSNDVLKNKFSKTTR